MFRQLYSLDSWTVRYTFCISLVICNTFCVLVERDCWRCFFDPFEHTQSVCLTRTTVMICVTLGILCSFRIFIADIFTWGAHKVDIYIQSSWMMFAARVTPRRVLFKSSNIFEQAERWCFSWRCMCRFDELTFVVLDLNREHVTHTHIYLWLHPHVFLYVTYRLQ